MKVITLNLNGIRSARNKGFFDWVKKQKADVICLQETKAHTHQLDESVLSPRGWHGFFNDAEKKGYSGVALYAKRCPRRVTTSLGWPSADTEGRFLQADFDGFSVVSLYLPSGTSGPERQAVKIDFMDRLLPLLKKMRRARRQFIVCGDWNIAHKKIDIRNWRGNQKHSGFLPEERAWLDQVFGPVGMVDAFRVVDPRPDRYTWWSNRGRAREKNVGWRIDYQVITPGLKDKVRRASIYTAKRFSDHAPLIIDYDIDS